MSNAKQIEEAARALVAHLNVRAVDFATHRLADALATALSAPTAGGGEDIAERNRRWEFDAVKRALDTGEEPHAIRGYHDKYLNEYAMTLRRVAAAARNEKKWLAVERDSTDTPHPAPEAPPCACDIDATRHDKSCPAYSGNAAPILTPAPEASGEDGEAITAALIDGTRVTLDSIRVRFVNGDHGLVALSDVPALYRALLTAEAAERGEGGE